MALHNLMCPAVGGGWPCGPRSACLRFCPSAVAQMSKCFKNSFLMLILLHIMIVMPLPASVLLLIVPRILPSMILIIAMLLIITVWKTIGDIKHSCMKLVRQSLM